MGGPCVEFLRGIAPFACTCGTVLLDSRNTSWQSMLSCLGSMRRWRKYRPEENRSTSALRKSHASKMSEDWAKQTGRQTLQTHPVNLSKGLLWNDLVNQLMTSTAVLIRTRQVLLGTASFTCRSQASPSIHSCSWAVGACMGALLNHCHGKAVFLHLHGSMRGRPLCPSATWAAAAGSVAWHTPLSSKPTHISPASIDLKS